MRAGRPPAWRGWKGEVFGIFDPHKAQKVTRQVGGREERKERELRFLFRKCLFLAVVNHGQAGFSKAFVRDVLICRRPDSRQEPGARGGQPSVSSVHPR